MKLRVQFFSKIVSFFKGEDCRLLTGTESSIYRKIGGLHRYSSSVSSINLQTLNLQYPEDNIIKTLWFHLLICKHWISTIQRRTSPKPISFIYWLILNSYMWSKSASILIDWLAQCIKEENILLRRSITKSFKKTSSIKLLFLTNYQHSSKLIDFLKYIEL